MLEKASHDVEPSSEADMREESAICLVDSIHELMPLPCMAWLIRLTCLFNADWCYQVATESNVKLMPGL